MSFFSNLFKRKPGGTFVGNLIRGVAHAATGGLLGNGAMMIQPNETPAQADDRLLQGLGAGVVAGQNAAINATPLPNSPTPVQSVQAGALSELWKTSKGYILGGLAAIVAICYFIFKKK